MAPLTYARSRLAAVIEEIERLRQSEFPYQHSQDALDVLESHFRTRLEILKHLDEKSDPATVKRECGNVLRDVFSYVPLLGFILRSTNVRNAFESYAPLLTMANRLIGDGTSGSGVKLLLSSEWKYSPHTFTRLGVLSQFVLIGLPATESGNSLLIPLAGHEFGHTLWARRRLGVGRFDASVRDAIVTGIQARIDEYHSVFQNAIPANQIAGSLLAFPTWVDAMRWGAHQTEEVFCDLVGLRIFGKSFARAFAYLLSPSNFGSRSIDYPPIKSRVKYIEAAATAYGVTLPGDFSAQFEDEMPPSLSPADGFRLRLADQACAAQVPALIDRANVIVDEARLTPSGDDEIARIRGRFRHVTPAEATRTIVDILNAAWETFDDTGIWASNRGIQDRRAEVLNELVLKNIELHAIESALSSARKET